MRTSLLLLLSAAVLTAAASEQFQGLILDSQGRPIQGARVACGEHSAFTTAEGRFALPGSEPGCDSIIRKQGFETLRVHLAAASENRLELRVEGPTETVQVSAVRAQLTPDEAGVAATVFTRDEITFRDYAGITDLLRDTPGVQVSNYSRRGGLTSVYTRGAQRTGTLVLIDGVPINDPGGEVNMAHVSSAGIDRVEVVRGPESTLFGAEASAGVVQLFTRRGDDETTLPHGEASYERGSFQTDRWIANLNGGLLGRLDYSLTADQLHTAGEYPNDFYRDTTGAANIGFRFSGRTQARTIFREYDAIVGTPNQVGFGIIDFSANQETRDSALRVQVDDERGGHFLQRAAFDYNRLRDRFNDAIGYGPYPVAALVRRTLSPVPRVQLVSLAPGATSAPAGLELISTEVSTYPYSSLNVTERKGADYQGTLTHSSGLLVFGYAFERQSGLISSRDVSRDNHGLFIDKQQNIGARLSLNAGIRAEHSSAFGYKIAPKAAASFRLFSGTVLRAGAGRGITEPSLYENFVRAPFAMGNAALRPEKTTTYEAGIAQELFGRRFRAEATVFRSSFRDLITYIYPSWQNIEASWARGFETSAQARVTDFLRLSGTYTRLYTRITSSASPKSLVTGIGQELVRRPRNSGSVSVLFTPRRWNVIAGARFVGERQDADFTFGLNRNPAYHFVFASASYQLTKHILPVLRIDNATDQCYSEVLGYPALSRNAMGGLRIAW